MEGREGGRNRGREGGTEGGREERRQGRGGERSTQHNMWHMTDANYLLTHSLLPLLPFYTQTTQTLSVVFPAFDLSSPDSTLTTSSARLLCNHTSRDLLPGLKCPAQWFQATGIPETTFPMQFNLRPQRPSRASWKPEANQQHALPNTSLEPAHLRHQAAGTDASV